MLAGIAQNRENDAARVAAVAHILDRGWGKVAQAHTGPDGEGEIKVTIRNIMEEVRSAKVIEARPVPAIAIGTDDEE